MEVWRFYKTVLGELSITNLIHSVSGSFKFIRCTVKPRPSELHPKKVGHQLSKVHFMDKPSYILGSASN